MGKQKRQGLTLTKDTRDQVREGSVLRCDSGFSVKVVSRSELRNGSLVTLEVITDANGSRWSSLGAHIYGVPLSQWYGTEIINEEGGKEE